MADQPLPPAIFLMGPTAAGKTALALALHAELPVDIVSVDAAQVYRGMDIGTAKPSKEEQARAPHRLIDIRDPAETYSAAEFREDALREMAAITRAGHIPLLVGGTMFYFHALEYGLAPLPAADPEVRERLTEEGARRGWPALHERLQAVDPETAVRIHPHDRQRIQRALEIYLVAGQAPSRLNAAWAPEPFPYRPIKLAVAPAERARLHERIAERFRGMLTQGLVEEVKVLYRRGDLSPTLASVRTVGYRQVWEYLTEKVNYYEMVERGIAATRQLAKRQLTWLRSYQGVRWLDGGDAELSRRSVDLVRQTVHQRL